MPTRSYCAKKRREVVKMLEEKGFRAIEFSLGNRGYVLAEGVKLVVRFALNPEKSQKIRTAPPAWRNYRFTIVCLGSDFYIIPREVTPPGGNLCFPYGRESKYSKYRNAWSLLKEAIKRKGDV